MLRRDRLYNFFLFHTMTCIKKNCIKNKFRNLFYLNQYLMHFYKTNKLQFNVTLRWISTFIIFLFLSFILNFFINDLAAKLATLLGTASATMWWPIITYFNALHCFFKCLIKSFGNYHTQIFPFQQKIH